MSARGGPASTATFGRGAERDLRSALELDACENGGAEEAKVPGGLVFGQPGQALPSAIRCNEIMLAVLQVASNPASCFGGFLRKSLCESRAAIGTAPRSDVWPCPPPRWRWTASQHLSPRRRHRRKFLMVRAKLLQRIVIALNWLTLGHAQSPPEHCRLGAPISAAQHAALERLEEMVDYFLRAPVASPTDLGRAGEKLENLLKASFSLHDFNSLSFNDVVSFLDVIQKDLDPYSKEPTNNAAASAQHASNVCSGAEPATAYKVKLATSPAKQVFSDRIKWKLGPSFDPKPYLSDPIVHAAFQDPEVLRKPVGDWPQRPRARVHCSREEVLRLAEKWDKLGACMLIPTNEIRADEAVGLFAVPKDQDHDRLIINPTVINSRMYNANTFTKTIAPGHLVGMIRLRPDEDLRISSDDLCEFYYTFKVSRSRAARNAIGVSFVGSELSHLQCYNPQLHQESVYICLATLAMGDGLAVEIAQQSHYNLLRQLGGCMDPKEVLAYRRAIPKGPFYELLTIDDHIGLQRVKKGFPLGQQPTRDKAVFKQSERAYAAVGLTPHPGKRQRQVSAATVLGAEVDGVVGRVSAPRSRLAVLMFCTAVVAQKKSCTKKILQSLIGSWVHALLFRRCIFSVLDAIYNEGNHQPPDTVFPLSPKSLSELTMLMLLGVLAQCDMRAAICPEVFMMDASPYAGAVCSSSVAEDAVDRLWLLSEQRGYYTRLEQGPGVVLREKGLDHAELFGSEAGPLSLPEGPMPCLPMTSEERETFHCLELFRGQGNWSVAHEEVGLRVHPGVERNERGVRFGDLSDDSTFLGLLRLADSGTVEEWHAAPPCWSFGTLRRPRLRSKAQPFGFDPADPLTAEQTRLAVRTAFLLLVALVHGCFISCEQPGSSVMFDLDIFKRLLARGCWLTKFCFCSFGSAFNKPSKWLHNKPWLLRLAGVCSCSYKNRHFVVQGTFTRKNIREFDKRCRPNCTEVYGRLPVPGEAVSAFSASYPRELCRAMARGSADFFLELGRKAGPLEENGNLRPWHEDPDWVHDLCEGLRYRELFRYRFKKGGHINCLECRVYKSWLKHCAKRWPGCRVLGLLDSRVTLGAAAKGRSSSKALSHILKTSLGYVLGCGLYPGGLHVRSAWNRADGPSRDGKVAPPTCERPTWLACLEQGDDSLFEIMLESAKWSRPLGRWVRLLLWKGIRAPLRTKPTSPAGSSVWLSGSRGRPSRGWMLV